jgi:hypothetical protein
MIEAVQDLPAHTIVDINQIADHPRRWVHLPADSDFHKIVVSVAMWIIALAICNFVLSVCQTVTM